MSDQPRAREHDANDSENENRLVLISLFLSLFKIL